jgi:hypothetical protein
MSNDLWEFNISTKEWTWVSGDSSGSGIGVYGTFGVAAPGNVPGHRANPNNWTDSSGNLWLFGGQGVDSTGASGWLNDLWEVQPNSTKAMDLDGRLRYHLCERRTISGGSWPTRYLRHRGCACRYERPRRPIFRRKLD